MRPTLRAIRRAPPVNPYAIDQNVRAMTKSDRVAVRRAIAAVYDFAKLAPPPGSHQVFVGSPLTAAIAFGIADGVWWLRANPAEHMAIFGRRIDDAELGRAAEEACERAVTRGAIAIYGVPPHLLRLIETAQRAVRQATRPYGAAVAADGARTLLHAARGMRAAAARRVTGTADPARDVTHAPLLREADAAIDRITRAAPEAMPGVVGFLLDRLAVWWRPGGRIRSDLVETIRLGVAIHDSVVVRVPGWRSLAVLATRAGPHFLHPAFWIVSDRPSTVYRDERWRAHNDRGVAITWRDGWSLPYLRGIPVQLHHVTGPPSINAIRAERNAEIRRVLIERYERGNTYRVFADANAQVLDEDLDRAGHPRRLLRIRYSDDDDPWVAIELTNTTPEPDGSRRRYLLRVPPGMRTCRDAVAWTFGLPADAYDPDDES